VSNLDGRNLENPRVSYNPAQLGQGVDEEGGSSSARPSSLGRAELSQIASDYFLLPIRALLPTYPRRYINRREETITRC
jgi:hypothetical protein